MSRTKRTQRGRRTELSEHQTLETRRVHYDHARLLWVRVARR